MHLLFQPTLFWLAYAASSYAASMMLPLARCALIARFFEAAGARLASLQVRDQRSAVAAASNRFVEMHTSGAQAQALIGCLAVSLAS